MRTAKELFQSGPHLREFQTLLASPAFDPAVQAALAVMVESMPVEVLDPSKSWDAYLQIVGARKLIETISRLHEKEEPPKAERWPTLNYSANQPKG